MMTIDRILSIDSDAAFEAAALDLFRYQAERCAPYRRYIELLGIDSHAVRSIEEIPFMPIELFKTEDVYCSDKVHYERRK